jgi:hypothetical protein
MCLQCVMPTLGLARKRRCEFSWWMHAGLSVVSQVRATTRWVLLTRLVPIDI